MFKNYISVSFLIHKKEQGKTLEIYGIQLFEVFGLTSFEKLTDSIIERINSEGYDINPKDITLTGINEISRRLYKRLTK